MAGCEILVNLDICAGCSSCSVSCASGNSLPFGQYRVKVRMLGSDEHDSAVLALHPGLQSVWIPVFQESCTLCVDRVSAGKRPYCVACRTPKALIYGDPDDKDSDVIREKARLIGEGYALFELELPEALHKGVTYATRR